MHISGLSGKAHCGAGHRIYVDGRACKYVWPGFLACCNITMWVPNIGTKSFGSKLNRSKSCNLSGQANKLTTELILDTDIVFAPLQPVTHTSDSSVFFIVLTFDSLLCDYSSLLRRDANKEGTGINRNPTATDRK